MRQPVTGRLVGTGGGVGAGGVGLGLGEELGAPLGEPLGEVLGEPLGFGGGRLLVEDEGEPWALPPVAAPIPAMTAMITTSPAMMLRMMFRLRRDLGGRGGC